MAGRLLTRPIGRCKAVMPCACCCDGIADFTASGVTMAVDVPSQGLSGSVLLMPNFTLFDEVLHVLPNPGNPCPPAGPGCTRVVNSPPDCQYCCAPADTKSCCNCGCIFGMPVAAATTCESLYHCTPTDNWPALGGGWSFGGAEFGCLGAGTGPGVDCNVPAGADRSATCGFYARFRAQCCSGACTPAATDCAGDSNTFGGVAVDCASLVCRCPHGLFVKFNGVACFPGSPGGFVDADATITVSAPHPTCGDPAGDHWPCPCPDAWPCPDPAATTPCWVDGHCGDTGGGGMAPEAMVARLSDAQVDAMLANLGG